MTVVREESHIDTDFTPYVPRLVIEWLADDPARDWREIDGTMAFVDISGFTAMSEKLATEGKAGAEQVTDVMNATFDALLRVAYAYGGGLLKFGGDALLLFFDDDGHERRAARAAFEMRKTLRAIGRPKTSAGTVTLRMHAGLNSGRFLFTLTGTEHRELIVSGPAASITVEMEGASVAGEILVGPETAAALPAAALGEPRASGFLLARPPDAEQGLKPLPPVDGLPLADCVPQMIREHIELGPRRAGASDGGRRLPAAVGRRRARCDRRPGGGGTRGRRHGAGGAGCRRRARGLLPRERHRAKRRPDRARRRCAARLGTRRRAAPAHRACGGRRR